MHKARASELLLDGRTSVKTCLGGCRHFGNCMVCLIRPFSPTLTCSCRSLPRTNGRVLRSECLVRTIVVTYTWYSPKCVQHTLWAQGVASHSADGKRCFLGGGALMQQVDCTSNIAISQRSVTHVEGACPTCWKLRGERCGWHRRGRLRRCRRWRVSTPTHQLAPSLASRLWLIAW